MVPGAASSAPVHKRLDGIDGDDAGRLAGFQRGENIFDIGGGAQRQRRIGQVHARGAHAHLRHRFFAGDIDGMAAAFGIFAQRLKDEGGFADAGIAADQQRRARHQPAAGDAVEFGDAGDAAGRRRVFGFQIFQREVAALDPPRGA